MTITRRSTPLVLAGAALALVATGCGSSSSTTSATATTVGAAAGTTVPAATAAAGTRVQATLTEFKMQLSQSSVAPGTYTFVAANSGTTGHALAIEGPGVSRRSTGMIQPGQSADLTVTLKAGTYQLYCPVGTHRQLGMNTVLTVGGTPASAVPAGPTTTAGSSGGGGY